MLAEHPHWQKGSTHRFERNCWLRSSAWSTTTTMCTFGRSSSGQITNYLSLHFVEAPGISFQETTAPTVAASTIGLWNTLQDWQGDAASWYTVKSLFRGLWAISHRIRGGVHPRHSFLPVPDHQLKGLQRETACDPIVQFVKKAILDGFLDTLDKQPAAIHWYHVSSNNSWGQLFLFSHKKGAIIRGKVIICASVFQILLTGSRALNILFSFPIK